MKHYIITFFFLLLVYSTNCYSQTTIDDIKYNDDSIGNEWSFDIAKINNGFYIIERNGVDIKQQPDNNSKTMGRYQYGDALNVIEINKDWLTIGERITRRFMRSGHKIESNGWEKVYIPKSATGKLSDIKLIEKDISVIASKDDLNKYLKLELISKSEFMAKKVSQVNYLIRDALYDKKNGIIELKCKDKIKKYTDSPDSAETDTHKYDYVGQIDFLNKYLIAGSYWEGGDYKFIDKTSCEETQAFCEFPFISPNKKNIICINANPYSAEADLELYSIKNNQTKLIIAVSFINWMPAVEKEKMFWSTDGYLYIPLLSGKTFWNEKGGLNEDYQYIKMKILPIT